MVVSSLTQAHTQLEGRRLWYRAVGATGFGSWLQQGKEEIPGERDASAGDGGGFEQEIDYCL